jgi:hypothetical protein
VVVVLECRGWGVTCCIITFMNPMSLELLKAVSIPDNCKCVDLVIAPFRCKDSRRRVMLWNNRTGTDNCEHGPRFVFTSQTHFWNSPLPLSVQHLPNGPHSCTAPSGERHHRRLRVVAGEECRLGIMTTPERPVLAQPEKWNVQSPVSVQGRAAGFSSEESRRREIVVSRNNINSS